MRSAITILFILLVTAFVYEGCGGYQQPIITGSSPSFVGLGSLWDLWLDTAASYIELSHATSVSAATDYTALGPYQSYSTGFTQFNINDVDIGSDGPANGASTFGFYINSVALFMAPFTTPGSIMPFVPPGTCPGDVSANWVKLRVPAGWLTNNGSYDMFGTMTYSSSTGATTINSDYNLGTTSTNDATTGPVSSGTALSASAGCNSGTISDGTVDTLVSSYGIVLHNLSDDSVYFAWPNASLPTYASLAGNYSGIIYSSGSSSNSGVSLALSSTGTAPGTGATGTGNILSDVTTGATTGTSFTINFGSNTSPAITAPVSGLLGGTINFGGSDQPVVCIPAVGAGGTSVNLLVCSANDGSGDFYSLVLLSH